MGVIGHRAAPVQVEGEARWHRDGAEEVEERIGDVEEVAQLQVGDGHRRLARAHLDRDSVGCYRDRPEEAVREGVNPRVEVVNLSAEVDEVELTSKEIKSEESERSFVDSSILADEDTAHEAYVDVEEECFSAAVGIGPSARALYLGGAHEAVEVCDARRFLARTEGEEVEQLTSDGSAAGDWVGRSIQGVGGKGRARTQHGNPECGADGARSPADKPAPGDTRDQRTRRARQLIRDRFVCSCLGEGKSGYGRVHSAEDFRHATRSQAFFTYRAGESVSPLAGRRRF